MTKDMTTGNPLKIILLFSVPVLLGNLFQQFYSMVDTIIVGRYLGQEALAAVGATGCLMFLVLGFANGIAQGFGVMVSHAFGANDKKLLKHYVALSLMLTVIISAVLTILTVAASRQFLIWMHTPDDMIELANNLSIEVKPRANNVNKPNQAQREEEKEEGTNIVQFSSQEGNGTVFVSSDVNLLLSCGSLRRPR